MSRFGIVAVLVVVPAAFAGDEPPKSQVNSQKIAVSAVPDKARQAADQVAKGAKWETAYKHTKEAGPTKLWYRLIGIQSQRTLKQEVQADGDVKEVEKFVDKAVQVRVLPEGEVVDMWTDVTPKEVPAVVMRALRAKESGAEVTFISSVRVGGKKEIVGYRIEVKTAGGEKLTYSITADGKNVEKEQ